MKLDTTDTEFNALELATAKRGEHVRVSKQALFHLIADHYTLLATAKRHVHIEAGEDQRSLR